MPATTVARPALAVLKICSTDVIWKPVMTGSEQHFLQNIVGVLQLQLDVLVSAHQFTHGA